MASMNRLYLRWIVANAAAEALGLGIVAASAVGLHTALAGETVGALLVSASALVALGAAEGAIVGYAQWWALHRALPQVRARSWIGATIFGALSAWTLGMLPSTLMHLGDTAAHASSAPPGPVVRFALAALLGAVAGPILGLFQWRVLRRCVPHAAWWLPANGLAWAAGMPVVFVVAGQLPEGWPLAAIACAVLGGIGLAGAVVGMIHGLALVRLLRCGPQAP
jgi:hypothetical protein